MKGLEVGEVQLSKTAENKDFRIDSAFYTTRLKRNAEIEYAKIGDCLLESQYGVSIAMNEDGIGYPIYRMNEIHSMLCDLCVDKYADVSSEEFETFKLNSGDVLFNRTNSYEWVGRTGVYYPNKDLTSMIFASYLVRFVPDNTKINSEYLTVFLSCQYGIAELRRRARQSINQTNINPEEVKEIEIPLLSTGLQKSIKDRFQNAHHLRLDAESLYSAAETLLLSSLGMTNFVPSVENVSIKLLSESFGTTGRLDAEFYQRKYEEYLLHVISYRFGTTLTKNVCDLVKSSFKKEKDSYPYIEISDINVQDGTFTFNDIITEELPANAKTRVINGDMLVSKVRPYRGAVAIIDKDIPDLIVSGAFTVLRSKKNYPRETLAVLFRTPIYRDWFLKWNVGTSYPVIKDEDILDMPIPLFPQSIHQQIADDVRRSFALRRESEQLLDSAKRAIEIAIEESEEAAIKWLCSETRSRVTTAVGSTTEIR